MKFPGENRLELPDAGLERGKKTRDLDEIFGDLGDFQGLDDGGIALKLIESGHANELISNLDKLQDLGTEVAAQLIDTGEGGAAARLDELPEFQRDIAFALLHERRGPELARNIASFRSLDHGEIALKLIEAGQASAVAKHLEGFQGLGHEVALKLIEAGQALAVAEHPDLFQGLGQDVAIKLIEDRRGALVALFLDKYQDLDHTEIALKMIETNQVDDLVLYGKHVQGLERTVADMLIEIGKGQKVIYLLDKFRELDRAEIALKLIEAGKAHVVAEGLDRFGPGMDKRVLMGLLEAPGTITHHATLKHLDLFEGLDKEVALKIIDLDMAWAFQERLHLFAGVDKELATKIIRAGEGDVIAACPECVSDLDHQGIAELLLSNLGKNDLIANLGRFRDLHQGVAERLIFLGADAEVLGHLGSFRKEHRAEIIIRIVERGSFDRAAVGAHADLEFPPEGHQRLIEGLLGRNQISLAAEFNRKSPTPDALLEKAYAEFGEALTPALWDAYQVLDADFGMTLKGMQELGVRHAGEAGINELRQGIRKFRHDLIRGEADVDLALESPLVADVLKQSVRYENSEWGQHDYDGFRDTLTAYAEAKDHIEPLPEGYGPSDLVHIAKVDKEKQDAFVHSEAFLARYGALLGSIKEARRLADDEQALNVLRDRLQAKRDALVQDLEGNLKEQKNPKAAEHLKKGIASLRGLDFRSLSHPQEMFNVLMSYRATFEEDLRALMFYAAYKLNPGFRQKGVGSWDAAHPTIDELTWTLDFTDHVTNQETMAEYFTDKEATKRFRGLLNVSALEQELARWQDQGTAGTMDLQFIPNRGILTEFSGHFSDACWASKYGSILEEFPNFIGLTIVKDPGDPKDESIAGGAFLIEADSPYENDAPLLIIRGLNPRENVINQLAPEDFMEKLVAYLKPMAEKMGRKLAIVIDDYPGGAATNRPVLFKHLEAMRSMLAPWDATGYDKTEFNGYDIGGSCYVIE